MSTGKTLGLRLDTHSVERSLNASPGTDPRWGAEGPQVGIEYRMNHVGCPSGEDTKKRLYAKMCENGVVMYYCHNCGKSLVTRNKSTYSNYRASKEYSPEDDSVDEADRSKPGDWERSGFAHIYEKAWGADPDIAPKGMWGVGTTEKILTKYGVKGWWWERPEYSAGIGLHKHFGGCLADGSTSWTLPDGREATVLRMFFPVFHPDAVGGLRMLSVKQVACLYDRSTYGDDHPKIPLPDGQWKWKHFVYNADGRISPIVDNPGQKVCVLVEDRISSLSIQGATDERVTSVCLNGTHIRDEHVFVLANNPAYDRFIVWLDNDSDPVRAKAVRITQQLRMYGRETSYMYAAVDPKTATNEYVRSTVLGEP
jgi:hypothetical protein